MIIAAFIVVPSFCGRHRGTFAPVLPGSPLIWLGMLIFGFMTGFEKIELGLFSTAGAACRRGDGR